MTRAVEAAGVELAFEESGEAGGAPVVLVHGTAADASLWRETAAALADGLRLIVYDRRAYGGSGAPEPFGGTTVEEQAEDAAALIEQLDAAPAVVCGHELGALVALDLALRHRDLVRGAVLIEPPLFALTTAGPELMSELREAIEAGARDGGAAGAVDAYLASVAGPGALDLLGPERASSARSAPRAFAADVAAAPAWQFSRADLRSLEAPVEVLAGTRAEPAWREVAGTLAELLPAGRLTEVEGGHLLPVEAPEAVADAVRAMAAR